MSLKEREEILKRIKGAELKGFTAGLDLAKELRSSGYDIKLTEKERTAVVQDIVRKAVKEGDYSKAHDMMKKNGFIYSYVDTDYSKIPDKLLDKMAETPEALTMKERAVFADAQRVMTDPQEIVKKNLEWLDERGWRKLTQEERVSLERERELVKVNNTTVGLNKVLSKLNPENCLPGEREEALKNISELLGGEISADDLRNARFVVPNQDDYAYWGWSKEAQADLIPGSIVFADEDWTKGVRDKLGGTKDVLGLKISRQISRGKLGGALEGAEGQFSIAMASAKAFRHEDYHRVDVADKERTKEAFKTVEDRVLSHAITELGAYRSDVHNKERTWNGVESTLVRTYLPEYIKNEALEGYVNAQMQARLENKIKDSITAIKNLDSNLPIRYGTEILQKARSIEDIIKWKDKTPQELRAEFYHPLISTAASVHSKRDIAGAVKDASGNVRGNVINEAIRTYHANHYAYRLDELSQRPKQAGSWLSDGERAAIAEEIKKAQSSGLKVSGVDNIEEGASKFFGEIKKSMDASWKIGFEKPPEPDFILPPLPKSDFILPEEVSKPEPTKSPTAPTRPKPTTPTTEVELPKSPGPRLTSALKKPGVETGAMAGGITALRAFTHDSLDEKAWHTILPSLHVPLTPFNAGRALGIPEETLQAGYQTKDAGKTVAFAHETAKTAAELYMLKGYDYLLTKGVAGGVKLVGWESGGSWLANKGVGRVAGPLFAAQAGWGAYSDVNFIQASKSDLDKRSVGAVAEGAIAGIPLGPPGIAGGAAISTVTAAARAVYEVHKVKMEGRERVRQRNARTTIENAMRGFVKHDSLADNTLTPDRLPYPRV